MGGPYAFNGCFFAFFFDFSGDVSLFEVVRRLGAARAGGDFNHFCVVLFGYSGGS